MSRSLSKIKVESEEPCVSRAGSKESSGSDEPERHLKKTRTRSTTSPKGTKKLFTCEICSKTFAGRFGLRRHLRKHTGENPYTCEVCGKSFPMASELRRHGETHVAVRKRHQCSDCGRSYLREQDLAAHQKNFCEANPSSGDKSCLQHTCEICQKTISSRKNLGKHMRTHTGEKPHTCRVCLKTFSSAFHQKRHERVHMLAAEGGNSPCAPKKRRPKNVGDFKCDICAKCFVNTRNLRRHRKTHSGEKPHACRFCSKRFYEPDTLKTHEMTHDSARKRHVCAFCDRTFLTHCGLVYHLKRHVTHGAVRGYVKRIGEMADS